MSLDDEWQNFVNDSNIDNIDNIYTINTINTVDTIDTIDTNQFIPKCGNIYISTKTKIVYLNTHLDIYNLFWKINILEYDYQNVGIIKKQMKISSTTKEQLNLIEEKLKNEKVINNTIINHIDNPNGRIKFKDTRKISIGINSKDLIYNRSKNKSAFYNCFVVTLRIFIHNNFKEVHVKLFNTGKLEIPGLKNDKTLEITLELLTKILTEINNKPVFYLKDKVENILINSNFNCGFFIDREKLFNILRNKYSINACYDPCSYPGIQCVYYYKFNNENIKISYMIFRTGSILMVGKCDEFILNTLYEYIKKILFDEYYQICINNIDETNIKKSKIKKIKKKIVYTKL